MRNRRIVDQVPKLWASRSNETRLRFKSPITSQQPISHNEPNLWQLEGRNHWLCPSTQIFSTGAPTVVFFSLLLLHGKYESEPRDLNIFYIPIKEDIGRFRHQISPADILSIFYALGLNFQFDPLFSSSPPSCEWNISIWFPAATGSGRIRAPPP